MRRRRVLLVCGAALLALAACSKKADQTAASASAPAAGEAGKSSAEAAPAGPPARKAGLWEQTISSDKVRQTIRMCVDEATEQKARWWKSEGRRSGSTDCSQEKVNRTLSGGWTIHSVCTNEGMTVTTDGTASGDFGNNYHVELTSVTTGSSIPQANGTRKMAMDGAWKGPCPAGWSGGDMEVNGMRMNVLNPQAPPSESGTSTSIMKGYSADHPPTQADIARMRSEAMEMAKKYKQGAQ